MIRLFSDKGKMLFFPKQWANSVTRWILGIRSPSGTIKIGNTAQPSEGGSATLDIDVERVAKNVENIIGRRYLQKKDFRSKLDATIDGVSIVASEKGIGISEEWLKAKIPSSGSGYSNSITVVTDVDWNGTQLVVSKATISLSNGIVTGCTATTGRNISTVTYNP